MGQMRRFFEEIVGPSWTELRPRPDLLLADAPGQTAPTLTVALAETSSGVRVAYLPNNSAITLEHHRPASIAARSMKVRWWDPSSNSTATTLGTCVVVAGGLRCPKPKAWLADALVIVE